MRIRFSGGNPIVTDQWTRIYNAFNPYEPVTPERLNEWYVERPKSPLEALLVELRPGKETTRFLLVGHPASGKSTELVKLGSELKARWGYFVVRIDLEQNLDIQKVNPVEALFLIGAAVFKVGHEELPSTKKPDRALLESLQQGLETIMTTYAKNRKHAINLDQVLAGLVCAGAGLIYAGPLGAVAGLVAGAHAAQALSKMVRFGFGTEAKIVRKHIRLPEVEEMVRRLNALIADVKEKSGRDLVLLVDGLDKPKELDIVALNFEDTPFLSDLTCRTVYTAPMWVAYHPRFAGVRGRFPIRPFPNVKLYDQKDRHKPAEDGYNLMRTVVYNRLRSLGLEAEKVLPDEMLKKLIRGSAGVMRDLIRLVRDANTQAEIAQHDQIGELEVTEALRAMYRELDGRLTPDYQEVLDEVHRDRKRINNRKCDELLHANMVLSYTNDEVWWDSHAILWSQPWTVS